MHEIHFFSKNCVNDPAVTQFSSHTWRPAMAEGDSGSLVWKGQLPLYGTSLPVYTYNHTIQTRVGLERCERRRCCMGVPRVLGRSFTPRDVTLRNDLSFAFPRSREVNRG